MHSLQKERGRTTQPQLKFACIAHGIDPVSHSRYFHSLAQLARWQAVPMVDIERGGPCASVSAPGTPLLWRPSEPRNRHTCARSCRYPEKPVSGRPLRHSRLSFPLTLPLHRPFRLPGFCHLAARTPPLLNEVWVRDQPATDVDVGPQGVPGGRINLGLTMFVDPGPSSFFNLPSLVRNTLRSCPVTRS